MTARKYKDAWWVDFRWRHQHGPKKGVRERIRKKSPVNNKRGAEEYERLLRARLFEGKPLDGSDPTTVAIPLFKKFQADFMETYAAANNKLSEQDSKRSMLDTHLVPRFGDLRLDAIGKHEIEKMRAELRDKKKLSAKRINNITGVLLKILRYAQEIELIDKVPRIRPLKVLPPKLDFFTFDEYERLVAAVADDVQLHAMVRLGGEGGLRKGEIAAVEQGDVDFHTKKITVRRSIWFRKNQEHVGSPKGGRERTIDMTKSLAKALHKARHLRGDRFFYRDGGWTPKVMENALKYACKKAGLRHVGWHVLRHTFCSHLAMSGADAKTIQEFAGHTTLAMTLRYMHLSPAHKREAIDRLDQVRVERGHQMGTAGPAEASGARDHSGK